VSAVKDRRGFAIIEILIAVALLAVVLMSVISGISAGIHAIAGNKNVTRALLVAKSRLNEFKTLNMRGPDLENEPVAEYPGFTFSRRIQRYQHEVFGPIPAQRVEIMVNWKERDAEKKYTLSYIYPAQ
jgi:prepilin-type N-terminal cleavage/methylation domain-containing protein